MSSKFCLRLAQRLVLGPNLRLLLTIHHREVIQPCLLVLLCLHGEVDDAGGITASARSQHSSAFSSSIFSPSSIKWMIGKSSTYSFVFDFLSLRLLEPLEVLGGHGGFASLGFRLLYHVHALLLLNPGLVREVLDREMSQLGRRSLLLSRTWPRTSQAKVAGTEASCDATWSNSLMDLDYDSNLLSNDPEYDGLNWNRILYENYLSVVVPVVAAKGDDKQHGCTILADIAVFQALSKWVAESKYRSNPEGFQRLIYPGERRRRRHGPVDKREGVLTRVWVKARAKATAYGRDPLISSLSTVYSAVHPCKLFVSRLLKLWSDLEVDLRQAELERETR
ncbi:hypothetical protein ACHAWF_001677, partial [Thalassiosira exigua]